MMGKYYGENRGHTTCPCCKDGQTPMSAKKTARQRAKKEIDEQLKDQENEYGAENI